MRYDLTGLGAQEFEELSQSLTIAALGSGVSVFGAGRDGGREATFDGPVNYPDDDTTSSVKWNGYGVIQAKFRRATTSTSADTDWFVGEVRKELDEWVDTTAARVREGRLPEYLIFTTNVTLSPVPGSGGIDRVNREIQRYVDKKNLPLRGWEVWHHDKICRLLEVHDGVRRTYGAFVTAGDVLADVQRALERLGSHELPDESFSELLTLQASLELRSQQWVRLNQAGDTGNLKLQLSAVGIDLPACANPPMSSDAADDRTGAIARIVEAGNKIRRPRPQSRLKPHLALVGGPGQGKTTLGQLVCQLYRVALLNQRPRHFLGPEVPELLDQYTEHFRRIGLTLPTCLRWPVRVPLNEFADALADRPSTTLLEYIAAAANKAGPINRRMLREWLREWPWLVVLDGLDEVAEAEMRESTLNAIGDFLTEAGYLGADLLVVATTRPQGYSDEFSPKYYQHFTLLPMQLESALEYANNLAHLQYAQDPEMEEQVIRRLASASAEPNIARLMRTPLQVSIMTLLLERQARLPQDRYSLFQAYYTTLYDREIRKNVPISQLLEQHRRNIDKLHERVGLLLQLRSEHVGEAEARLPETELHDLAYRRLVNEEGFAPAQAKSLAKQLVKAATDRLVMLVGRPNATVGFEIRSLQELMAGRALFEAREQDLLDILRDLAPSAHWRNTWLFAVSRIFAEFEHRRSDVITLLDDLDTADALSRFLLPGAELALAILEEDIATVQPRFTRLLADRALKLLDTSPGSTMGRLARVLNDAAAIDTEVVHLGMNALNARLSSIGKPTVAALDAVASWAVLKGDSAISARSLVSKIVGTMPLELQPIVASVTAAFPRAAWFSGGPPRPSSLLSVQELIDVAVEADCPASAEFLTKVDSITAITEVLAGAGIDTVLAELNDLGWRHWQLNKAMRVGLESWVSRNRMNTSSVAALVEPTQS
jgi:hypothetical protein